MVDEVHEDEPDDLIAEVERLVQRLSGHADASVRADAQALLAGIDAIHRTALAKLVGALESMGGQSLMTRLLADPAIRLLLMSYDLVAVDRRLMAEEALDGVRGHLHAHGVDVELVDVLGGVVYVQFHGLNTATVSEALVKQDVEAALAHGLRGFQQLEVGARRPTAEGGSVFVPMSALRTLKRPVMQVAARAQEIGDGAMLAADLDGHAVLLINADQTFFALQDRCGESPLPLRFSKLEEHTLICSWHGCRYDIRTGRRLDRDAASLQVYPVRVEEGNVLVAVGTSSVGVPQ